MNDVYFKASLQNTLNPEVGTFDNVNNKEGTFTLEDGEYYLTNNTSTSYRVYYPTKHLYSVGFTIEFDVNYDDNGDFGWCLVFNGDESTYWHGFGVWRKTLQYRGQTLPNYDIVTSPSTWLHIKCTFNYDYEFNRNDVHIYVDNVEVNNFTIDNNYDIKYIDILGNSGAFVPNAKIKNIIIYDNKKHYLDTNGLTSLWSKIKSLFATKTELASKANDSDVVHKSGDETIAGTKTFTSSIVCNATDGWIISRDTDGNFFKLIHTGWSSSESTSWAGMYFCTPDNRDVFAFAARKTISPFENFTIGNNGYIRGYDTNGSRSVTLTINGGTAGQPDTQNITVGGTFVNDGNQRPFSKNKYTIGTSDMPYQAMYAGTFNTDTTSKDSGLIASNSSTKHSLLFGIGDTGVNRGIYDKKNSRWSVFLDNTDYIMTQCPTPPEGDSSNKLATTEWVQTELDSVASKLTIYDLVPDGATNHRNFYRGKDITADFDSGTFSTNVANGSFKDIFPGDYITKSITVPQILKADGTTEYIAQKTYTVNFIIADLDIWLNRGDTATTEHHVAIVPERVIFNSIMNETNVTNGGYLGSFMNTNVMPAFATGLQNAFGSAHILQFRFLDTKAVNNDLKSGGIVNFTGATYWGGHDWTSHYCHLMTETMVYGAPITASCAVDETMGGVQFVAFRLNNSLVYNRQNYWLGDVVSSTNFADVSGYSTAYTYNASSVRGVRPFALLC